MSMFAYAHVMECKPDLFTSDRIFNNHFSHRANYLFIGHVYITGLKFWKQSKSIVGVGVGLKYLIFHKSQGGM